MKALNSFKPFVSVSLLCSVIRLLAEQNGRILHTTLITLIRYRGHCVYAIALAPLSHLVYGSEDAGKHVAAGESLPVILPIVDELSRALHVCKHKVLEKSSRKVKSISLAIDSEVWVGGDNRIYILDQARQMPPTPIHHHHEKAFSSSSSPSITLGNKKVHSNLYRIERRAVPVELQKALFAHGILGRRR